MLLLFLFMLTFATITTPMARGATTTVCILFVIRDTCTVVFAWMTWARRLQSKDKTRQISESFHSWSITTVWLKLKKNCFQIYSMAFKRRGSRRNRFCKSRRRQKNCVLKKRKMRIKIYLNTLDSSWVEEIMAHESLKME